MKKTRKPKPAQKKRAPVAPPPAAPKLSRRQFGTWLQYGVLGTVVVGGVGGYAVTSVLADVREQDLSVIGNGTPAVIQIHDPACGDCTVLQREARDALDAIGSDELTYRVASLVSTDGQDFAREHGVGRVTLMLFDGEGQVFEVLTGPRSSAQLQLRFQALLDAS